MICATTKKILSVELYKGSPPNELLHQELGKMGYSMEVYPLGVENTLPVLLKSFFVPRRLSQYDVVVTSEYFSAFATNLRLILTGGKAKHVTIGMNQSRRLLKTGIGLLDRLLDAVFRRNDLVVVHSRREAELFNRIHNISPRKFYFSLWGYDLPAHSPTRFSSWPRPYVCLVGRNNRDAATFTAAIRGMDIDGIIITSRHADPIEPPPNVKVFFDLPLEETLDCIKHARANAILLKDNDRGAGHITAVAAMFLGTPQVVSNVDVIKDYFVNGVNAIAVSLGNVTEVRAAFDTLISRPEYARWLSGNAREYAEQWLTNERVVGRITSALRNLTEGHEFASVDQDWLEAYTTLARLSEHEIQVDVSSDRPTS